MGLLKSILVLLVMPLGLIPALPPITGAGGVRDDGSFFSADAIAHAQQVIGRIHDDHHRDVLVETIADLPQEQKDELQRKGKDRFWQEWADSRAKASGISGVYIVISKSPGHLQAAVGNETAKSLFTLADRDELVRRMLEQFRQKQYDQGLLDAVDFIAERMNEHVRPDKNKSSVSVLYGEQI